MRCLREHGIHAYAVNSMQGLFGDEQLAARHHWREVEHPVIGRLHVAAPPFLLSETPPVVDRAAPMLGADTEYVLVQILGLSTDEIRELDQAGVLT